MTEKEIKDPILSRSVMPNKNDILIFKNETLKDFKEVQKKVTEKYKNLDLEVREKLESYEQRIVTYENKIIELSNLINTDKTIRDKVDKLMEFKEKADDKMLTEKIRLDNFRNDLNSNVERIDQILKDSVIYPGVIGGISKYKTFHDLIDYVLTQTSQNLTFREKSILDFKGYKNKLENLITSFNTQINTLLNTTSEFTKTSVKELEEKIKSIFNVYDDRLQDTRLENANYAVGLERATEALKKELEKLEIIKKELYEKVDNGILEVKNDNTRVTKLFSGYKKNFHIMQHKFTQLSDFIKDIRFRINLKEDVNRREYSHMSDLINFDKKKKAGFYDGVYDHNIIKKGLASQLKEYIEGRITADQLFKKRGDQSKSMGKIAENKNNNIEATKRKSLKGENNEENNEEVKLNFVDLLKNTISKRTSLQPDELKNTTKSNHNKEIIKEEEEEDNNNSKEINPVFYKTLKEKNINKNILEKEQEKIKEENKINKNKIIDKNKSIDSKSFDKNKSTDRKENVKLTKEESKIKIVSKNKENYNKKTEITNSEKKIERPSIKNVINDLFNVKNIINNIKNAKNEPNSNDKNANQSDKLKSENSKSNDTFTVLINEKKVEQNKIKHNKSYNRPGTSLNIKNNNNEPNYFKQNVYLNDEINNYKNRINSGQENKKIEPKSLGVNIYNATMDSFGHIIPTINSRQNNNKKKSNSSNQKNTKFYLKQNTVNPSTKANNGVKKEDSKAFENIFNNLTNYIPKNDINMDETNYIGLKKKK